jgi:hypothetical protein
MPRRRRRRRRAEPGGAVFAHVRKRRQQVAGTDSIPPAVPETLMTGRITTLVDRLRLRRHR